jgi:RecA/RadA recombinase
MVVKEKVQVTENKMVAGLDINKIVKKAQEFYGKEKGLAKQLSTGDSIIRPTKDEDFVLWTGGDHWFKLTRLKGLPYGKITQISGRPDSGKSTHALSFMKYAQDQNVAVILWDSERKFNAERFDKQMLGRSSDLLVVDTNDIIGGAKAVAYFIHAIKEQKHDAKILIVWDSVGASINSTESDEEAEDFSRQPGVAAKENGWALRKFNKLMNQYIDQETGGATIAVLCINQVYANIGSVGVTEKGGQTLQYLSSLIVQLTRKKDLTRVKGGEKIKFGIQTVARTKKNHLFDGADCLAQTDIVVSAAGIHLLDEIKKASDIKGWDESQTDNDDEGDE